MHDIKVYETDDAGWTFSIDGVESCEYVQPCDFPAMIQVGNEYVASADLGLPNDTYPQGSYGVWRMIRRIMQGNVREVSTYHRGSVEKLQSEEGEGRKYTYKWDGSHSDKTFGSEQEARAALGVHGFMNRGANGRLDEVKDLFNRQHTARTEKHRVGDQDVSIEIPRRKAADCCLRDGKIVLTDDQGAEHICCPDIKRLSPPDKEPFRPPMDVTFKQVTEGTAPTSNTSAVSAES